MFEAALVCLSTVLTVPFSRFLGMHRHELHVSYLPSMLWCAARFEALFVPRPVYREEGSMTGRHRSGRRTGSAATGLIRGWADLGGSAFTWASEGHRNRPGRIGVGRCLQSPWTVGVHGASRDVVAASDSLVLSRCLSHDVSSGCLSLSLPRLGRSNRE